MDNIGLVTREFADVSKTLPPAQSFNMSRLGIGMGSDDIGTMNFTSSLQAFFIHSPYFLSLSVSFCNSIQCQQLWCLFFFLPISLQPQNVSKGHGICLVFNFWRLCALAFSGRKTNQQHVKVSECKGT